MLEWWINLPTGMADAIVVVGGMSILGAYAAVAQWWETRAK